MPKRPRIRKGGPLARVYEGPQKGVGKALPKLREIEGRVNDIKNHPRLKRFFD